ncbi:MAG: hypothetical protein MUE69_13750 [Myxococcota bacterium]|nr:hypothetical protein [Myxococcota bacterium]
MSLTRAAEASSASSSSPSNASSISTTSSSSTSALAAGLPLALPFAAGAFVPPLDVLAPDALDALATAPLA